METVSRKTIYKYIIDIFQNPPTTIKFLFMNKTSKIITASFFHCKKKKTSFAYIIICPKDQELLRSLVLKSPNFVCLIILHLTSNKFVEQYQYANVIPKKSNKKHWVGTFSITLLRTTFISYYFISMIIFSLIIKLSASRRPVRLI